MKTKSSMVISMRLSNKSGERLKRMATRHGWTASDASARLVEEGLRRADFAFIDFRDSVAGRLAYIQGSSLAVWEVMMLARDYEHGSKSSVGGDKLKAELDCVTGVAKHLRWPEAKVKAAFNYAKAFPDEVNEAMADNDSVSFKTLSQMLPQAKDFIVSGKPGKPGK
jgi:hypothetical protein